MARATSRSKHESTHSKNVSDCSGRFHARSIELSGPIRKDHLEITACTTFMPKRTSSPTLALPPQDESLPAFRWLYSAMRDQILEGCLRPGTRLPATRELAKQYGLSRGTIVSAFELLKSEGYTEGAICSGTYVSRILPEELMNVGVRGGPTRKKYSRTTRRLSEYGKQVTLFRGYDKRPTRAFRANVPGLDAFPMELWTQITTRVLRRASTNHLLGCDPLGYEPLRQAIADYLSSSRGVNCEAAQVTIVSGVQEGLDLAARLLVNPGERVCMEQPGFLGAAQIFEAVGAKVSTIALDEQGMKLEERRLRGARLVYVTPGHQFPLGITMSLPRRLELLKWASRSGSLIFEDDYDGEFRYSGRPIPALQGLDHSGCVLYAGSFSKVLFPAMRLAYIVVPADLVDRVAAAKSLTTRHAPVLDQAVLCEFIADGHFGRHVRRMRELYGTRLSALLEAAHQDLAGLLEVSPIEAGLQTVGWLRRRIREESAAEAAKERDVDVTPLSHYCRQPLGRQGLQLGFAGVGAREIRRGVRDLAAALARLVDSESLGGTELKKSYPG
jgi:GntR family transcriptional regulator / MocR family aminotransferase